MVALKGNPEIGDLINKNILGPLAQANSLSDMPDFNDSTKLGDGKEKIERLTNLIAIFENPALDFSKNRADGDDLLGDAYEYLMRHSATEVARVKDSFIQRWHSESRHRRARALWGDHSRGAFGVVQAAT
jgi:type I restriction enzyme M protein